MSARHAFAYSRVNRFWLALTGFLALGCESGPVPPEPPPPPPTVVLPRSSPPPASVEPVEPEPADTADPEFERFAERLHERCAVKDEEQTTARIARAGRAKARCLAQQAKRGWGDAWIRLVDSVCGVQDAETYVGRIRRMAGSARYVDNAFCRHDPFIEAAYLARAMAKGNVSAFEARVRATAPRGRRVLASIAPARDSVERLRHLAPEDSLFNDECWNCVLADSDWRRFSLRLQAIEQESGALGEAVCRSWRGLAARIGGECKDLVSAHFASYLDKPVAAGPGLAADDYRGLPPAKDAAYRELIEPVIDGCRKHESLRYSSLGDERKALACLKRRLAGYRPDATWREFERVLCRVEKAAHATGFVSAYLDRFEGLYTFDIETLECPALSAARGIFVHDVLGSDRLDAFVAHLQARIVWSSTVKKGMVLVRKVATTEPCTKPKFPPAHDCRSGRLAEKGWARLVGDLTELERAAASLGAAVCERWPSLSARLPTCGDRLRDYFLSYPNFLGLVAV